MNTKTNKTTQAKRDDDIQNVEPIRQPAEHEQDRRKHRWSGTNVGLLSVSGRYASCVCDVVGLSEWGLRLFLSSFYTLSES